MKSKKRISRFLILGILSNNIYSCSNAYDLNRYETLEGEVVFLDDVKSEEITEIEIFGNTVQDSNNLSDIQSVGDLYVNKYGNPILDTSGRKQYRIDIVSDNLHPVRDKTDTINDNLQPIKEGLVSWVDAEYGQPGDTVWKDISGNNNNFILKGFAHDGVDGFNGKSLRLSNTRILNVESYDYIQVKKDESYSLEIFFDGEYINYLIGLQKHENSTTHGSYVCTFAEKDNYAVAYDGNRTYIDGHLNSKNNHVVLIKDGKNDKLKVYLNTVLVHEIDIEDDDNSTNQKVHLGALGDYSYVSNIDIYSHRRYNSVLTESEIVNNYRYELQARQNETVENVFSLILPYQLQKVGDVADRLYWDNSQCKYLIEKNIKELTLDGTETDWIKSTDLVNLEGQNTVSFQKPMKGIIYNSQKNIKIISDKFKALEIAFSSNIIEDKEWIRPYSSSSANVGIRILKSKLSGENVEDFKQWLKSNPVTVYYQLSSPEITSTEIKDKLNIVTYSNQTYIYVDSKNGIKPCLKIVIDRLPKMAEDSVVIAEANGLIKDISLARMYINMLPESIYKDKLQERLNSIFATEMALDKKTISSSMDLYIKFKNTLSMGLNTNSITFEDYSGVEDMELLNAVNITVESSLPYDLNAYMPNMIYNSDKTNSIDINTLNIKESTKTEYQQFTNITDKVVLNSDCDSGNKKYHAIDLKLSGGNTHKVDIYKTALKFEVEQK